MKKIIEALKTIQEEIAMLEQQGTVVLTVDISTNNDRRFIHVYNCIDKVAREISTSIKDGKHTDEYDKKHFEFEGVEIFELVKKGESI